MIPQYSLKFNSEEEAQECFGLIEESRQHFQNIHMKMYLNGQVVTLAVSLSKKANEFFIGDKSFSHKDLGFRKLMIEDHNSGKNCPEGSLIIYNSKTSSASQDTVDYLEYAPAVLKFFGLDVPEYMIET